jgi:hemolysin type calcium-binding protein
MGEVSLGPKSWRQFGPSPDVPPLVRVFTEGHTATVRVKEDARVMYQMNDIEMMREHRQALLKEAEGDRLARRLEGGRPKREGSYAAKMRRRAALLLSTIGLAVLLIASAAYALDIQCPPSIGGDPCIGTDGADAMVGTDGLDTIVGLDGNDTIRGLGAPDRLTGDGNAATVPGDDELFGGDGSDHLFGGAGADLLSGEEGADEFAADFLFNDGTDTIEGGPGNDTVHAVEGQRDVIDCGPGRDSVEFDVGLDP